MITIGIADFTKYTQVKRDWIVTKCIPIKNNLGEHGLLNLYDTEHILKVARRILMDTNANYNLARSKKISAIKTLNAIIAGIERYIKNSSNIAA